MSIFSSMKTLKFHNSILKRTKIYTSKSYGIQHHKYVHPFYRLVNHLCSSLIKENSNCFLKKIKKSLKYMTNSSKVVEFSREPDQEANLVHKKSIRGKKGGCLSNYPFAGVSANLHSPLPLLPDLGTAHLHRFQKLA